MRLDYLLPLFYPDFSLGSLAYFKRIKSALFYDYGQGTYNDEQGNSITTSYQSVGIDLRTDIHFLRHLAPFDIGLRTYYRLNDFRRVLSFCSRLVTDFASLLIVFYKKAWRGSANKYYFCGT
jgi:hypothetical protein